MGNRAVIAYESQPGIGIYVHWNGGVESMLAFLEAAKQRGARKPGGDSCYSFARLTQTIADYFDGGECSIGVGPLSSLDCSNGDNGLYWIGGNWEITKREHSNSLVRTVEQLSDAQREKYESMVTELTTKRV